MTKKNRPHSIERTSAKAEIFIGVIKTKKAVTLDGLFSK